jgi:hypothetical protein
MEGENSPDRGFFHGMPFRPVRPFIPFMANLMLIFGVSDNIPL